MNDDPSFLRPLVGLVRIREHCTFAWRKITADASASIEVGENHCLQCIADARQRGYRPITTDGKEVPG